MDGLMKVFGDVKPFLEMPDEFSEKTKAKLLEFFEDSNKLNVLKVELASVIAAGKPFVEATYKIESDGLIVFECYDIISSLSVSVKMENYPNVQAVVKSIASKKEMQLKWMRQAKQCIKPAFDYFTEHVKADLMNVPLKAFKAARIFDPHYLKKVKPECASLDSLSLNIPFITESTLAELKEEYPKYAALVDDISPEYTTLDFWTDNTSTLPKWSNMAKNMMLIQPSSAGAERAFSILNRTFGSQQLFSLEDYLEASVMFQYNY